MLPARNATPAESTAAVGGLKAERERIVDAGPEIGAIERAAGRRVERAQLRDVDRVEAVRAAKPGSGAVTVFRRKLGDAPKGRRPPEPEPGLVREGGGRGPIDDATRRREATQLEARPSQAAKRLVEIHEREARDTTDPAKATELARRHEAELRELKAQLAREMRTLER